MKSKSSPLLAYNEIQIIQVENPKSQAMIFSKKSRLSFLGVLITSKLACIKCWSQELNFLKFPCDPGIMDLSMKCKSFPVLSYDEIQSFKLKIKKDQDNFPEKLFRGADRLQNWPVSNP